MTNCVAATFFCISMLLYSVSPFQRDELVSMCIHFLQRNWATVKKLIAWVSYFFVVCIYSAYYQVFLKPHSQIRRWFFFLSKGSENSEKQSGNQIVLSGSCAIASDSDSDFVSGTEMRKFLCYPE